MRRRWRGPLPLLILALAVTAGCGREHSGDTTPFNFDQDPIVKATISRGDGQWIAEFTDEQALNRLRSLLDHAPAYPGAYPFDLLGVSVLESKDGSERKLSVTGNGHVFVDETAKIGYELDKDKFLEVVEGLK